MHLPFDMPDTRPLIACVGHCSIDHVFQIEQFPERATKNRPCVPD